MTSELRTLLATSTSIAAPSAPSAKARIQVAVAAAPAPALVNFTMERQVRKNWCWAATAKSVSHFYDPGSNWTQCLVAERMFPTKNCCNSPIPCDQPASLELALGYTSNANGIPGGPLTFAAIEAEIVNDRVIGARTAWRRGGAHFVVIHGCYQSRGVNYLNIDDPIIGKTDVDETVFLRTYNGKGTWTTSYLTQS